MQEVSIHLFPVLVAAIARMVIGAVWYSPALFLKRWHKLTGVTQKQMKAGMPKALAVDFVGSLLMAFVLVHAIRFSYATTPLQGLAVGFFNWLGFVAVATIGSVTYEGKPFKLFLLNNGYLLLSLLAMSAILAVWG